MLTARLEAEDDFDGWRDAARTLAATGVPADQVVWRVGDAPGDLFGGDVLEVTATPALKVPKAFADLARSALLHSQPQRFSWLYALLLRVLKHPHIINDRADAHVRRIEDLSHAVGRDIHKMRAFVRFRELSVGDVRRLVAWFEPDHHILRANTAFFVRRFANREWSILTPAGSVHWDRSTVSEGPAGSRADLPETDPLEATWKAYYAAIFNPARLMPAAMLKEMPKKYWKNMPETALIPGLIAGARKRELGMIDHARAAVAPSHPKALTLLEDEAKGCRRCPLWQPATQTVFGEGPPDAEIMVVGEQPGDQEDLAGRAFVGPAGQLLDRALAAAGIDRTRVYITNAVKHFKFQLRGKRRIHASPNAGEIDACRWWLDQERAIVRPRIIIAMGASAARALTGRTMTIGDHRGRAIVLADDTRCWITVHPSALLRLPPDADHEGEYTRFVADLGRAAASMAAVD